jgi:Flp pilus assembly protein protease CpaA
MGGGDIKLAASMGAVFGYYQGIEIIAYSNVIALIYIIFKKLRTGQLKLWLQDSVTVLKNLKYGIKPEIPADEEALSKETIPLGAFFLSGVFVVMLSIGRGV